jgi:hypothetical protein
MMKMAQEIARRVEQERERADRQRGESNITGSEKVQLQGSAHSPDLPVMEEEGPPPAYGS